MSELRVLRSARHREPKEPGGNITADIAVISGHRVSVELQV